MCTSGCLCVDTCTCVCICVCLHVSVCARYTCTSWSGRVKLWADTFGRDLYDTVTKYSGSLLLQKVSDSLPGGGRAVSQGVLRERGVETQGP